MRASLLLELKILAKLEDEAAPVLQVVALLVHRSLLAIFVKVQLLVLGEEYFGAEVEVLFDRHAHSLVVLFEDGVGLAALVGGFGLLGVHVDSN